MWSIKISRSVEYSTPSRYHTCDTPLTRSECEWMKILCECERSVASQSNPVHGCTQRCWRYAQTGICEIQTWLRIVQNAVNISLKLGEPNNCWANRIRNYLLIDLNSPCATLNHHSVHNLQAQLLKTPCLYSRCRFYCTASSRGRHAQRLTASSRLAIWLKFGERRVCELKILIAKSCTEENLRRDAPRSPSQLTANNATVRWLNLPINWTLDFQQLPVVASKLRELPIIMQKKLT